MAGRILTFSTVDERHGRYSPPLRHSWIIDFGWEMGEREAALYEAPFAYCLAKSNLTATKTGVRHIGDPGGGMSSHDRACGDR